MNMNRTKTQNTIASGPGRPARRHLVFFVCIFQREYCAACEATSPQRPVHTPHGKGVTLTIRSGRAHNPMTKEVLPAPGPRDSTSTEEAAHPRYVIGYLSRTGHVRTKLAGISQCESNSRAKSRDMAPDPKARLW